MVRIWLNHWFSTAYHIILLLKKDDPDFQIIGSNENAKSPIMTVCDEWYQEPALKDEEYVDFCLQFCREHQISLFMPRRGALSVSKNARRFAEAGVKVMTEEYAVMRALNHKDQAYTLFQREQIGIVPEHYVVTTAEQFLESYHTLEARWKKVCFKFVRDEGGKSYRLIDNSRKGYSALFRKLTTRMPLDAVIDALSEREKFPPLMVMPYLSGDEVSVDCLKTDAGLIAVPRVKDTTRIEKIRYDPQILSFCKDLYTKIPLEQPCNIQFKYLDGVPYILEVNTRMSGGVQMACEASGINIPNIAANKLLGIQKPWEDRRIEKDVCHIEYPLVL